MKANNLLKYALILLLLATNIGCDQISKNIVRKQIEYNQHISVIDNFVTLTKIENTGAFLGLGDALPRPMYILLMIILPLIAIGLALYYIVTRNNLSRLTIFGICLFAGGGLGNIYDRILYSSVTDFLHFDFVIFQTGIVNMADVSVTFGFIVILFDMIINKGKLEHKVV